MKRQRTEHDKNFRRIKINASGTIIETTFNILTKYPESSLALLFNETDDNDENFVYFIDTDSKIFSYIIQYLRRNIDFNIIPFDVDKNLWKKEIDFWCLSKKEEFSEKLLKIGTEIENLKNIVYDFIISDKTNFMEEFNKGSRYIKIYIPHKCEYNLPNGCYLTDFIKNYIDGTEIKLTENYFLYFEVRNDEFTLHHKDYLFNNKKYNTYTNSTFTLIIRIKEED